MQWSKFPSPITMNTFYFRVKLSFSKVLRFQKCRENLILCFEKIKPRKTLCDHQQMKKSQGKHSINHYALDQKDSLLENLTKKMVAYGFWHTDMRYKTPIVIIYLETLRPKCPLGCFCRTRP